MANYKRTTDKQWSTPNYPDSLTSSTVVPAWCLGLIQDEIWFFGSPSKHLFLGNYKIQTKLSEVDKMLMCTHSKSVDELSYIQPFVTVIEEDLISRIQKHPSFNCPQRVEVSAGQGHAAANIICSKDEK
mmetsp:Transcript_7892/g.11171  ORF Transcript_7892/g.11171 Transcript_7892/m.11171 type:complete len:129 (-) Transcript_7892:85-471(-)